MITRTSSEKLARQALAEPEHAEHAAIIVATVAPAYEGDRSPRTFTTCHPNVTEAIRQLDYMTAGKGNYRATSFRDISIGTAFDLLRNNVARD
jgi:hypothetical protein